MADGIDVTPIRKVFALLHGMYGNALLEKFRTGQVNAAGEDKGLVSAQRVWAVRLAEFPIEVLQRAVVLAETKHPTFPPSLPEFVELCRAARPRAVASASVPRLTVDPQLSTAAVQRARDAIAATAVQRAGGIATGHPDGIPTLIALIAKAVGHAGGDEVAALATLEQRHRAEART